MKQHSQIGLVSIAALAAALTGCVGYVDGPGYGEQRTTGHRGGVVRDDYLYYPGQQVYYSSNRRQYIYQDGGAWVTRSSPPRVSAGVLLASPSVRLDFHDSPQSHHSSVVRQYPRQWGQAGRPNGGLINRHDQRTNNW